MKSAFFFFYSLIGALAAFFISAVASMALASLSEDVLFNGSGVYPGLYIYDEEENALVKAEDMSWYEATEGELDELRRWRRTHRRRRGVLVYRKPPEQVGIALCHSFG